MNFHSNSHSLRLEYVEQPRPHPQHLSEVTVSPSQEQDSHQHDPQLRHPTAIPHGPSPSTPPPVSPPSPTSSDPDLYGPDGVFGAPLVARPYRRPVVIEGPYRRVSDIPPLSPYQQPGWEGTLNAAMLTDFRDELARLDGVVTPGVDNTPFIQYAIEALTRGRDAGSSGVATSGTDSSSSNTGFVPGQRRQQYQPGSTEEQPPMLVPLPGQLLSAHASAGTAQPDPRHQRPPRPFIPNPQASAHSLAESLLKGAQRPVQPYEWRPVERDEILARAREFNATEVPPLSFRPWVLRAPALFGFMALCVLMIAALILSAVYSHLHQGLLEWAGIHGGRYFLFRIFPQLVAAAMLLYSQFVTATMLRILPFVRLASHVPEERDGALFQELYPSFLWPRLVGPWNVWVPILVTWLMNFTVPLQSSLFTVILVGQTWIWATVQGVAWTLVALYLALLASTVIVWRYWASLENTGLIWDPRSLADIACIVSETNTADDYRGTQIARGREGIRFALRRRAGDRLGYWTWKDGRPGFWHALGSPMDDVSLLPIPDLAAGQRMERHNEKQGMVVATEEGLLGTDQDVEASRVSDRARYRYLPWCLRNNQLLWFTITAFVLLLAIFVVSFLPSSRIASGFLPGLKADPQPGAFSSADFLYSFLPSLLGMVVFLLFQSLDLHLRILQPWAALSDPRGSPAEPSLLADYAACAPLQTTLHALRNRHWRLAAVSLLSTLFILIPVLAGGTFMALTITTSTTSSSSSLGEVRMFPNMPAYALLLALLVLYLGALVSLFPGRRHLRMPHAVTCLAEIVGFLVNAELRDEVAFKRCMSREELLDKLGVRRGTSDNAQPRWAFGLGDGSAGGVGNVAEGELGVRRLRRFTEKRRVRRVRLGGLS
ncbi:hypothetical protein VTK56DRAFT_3458 [Thermocarpiscus australiensis]